MRYLLLLLLGFFLMQCSRVDKLSAGQYQVADQEYSSQNYNMKRSFVADGSFRESHEIDRCVLMEMAGMWKQKGGTLTLEYQRVRNRQTCRDSLPAWGRDSTALTIPVRNVDGASFESFLAAADGHGEKWLKWIRLD